MPKFHTLVDIFRESVQRFPENPLFGTKRGLGHAAGSPWQWMTYREFGRQTDTFRAALASLGVKRGDAVGIIANNRPEWAIAAYACYGLGASLVPMYEVQPAKDWEFILADCSATVVLVATDALVTKARHLLETIPSLTHLVSLDSVTPQTSNVHTFESLLQSAGNAAAVESLEPTASDVACLIYTSGTTGNPKGVILSHGNIASNVSAIHDIFPMSPSDRSLSFLPWAHSFGQTVELHALFSMGASMAICESVDKILDNLVETQPTLLFSVPRIFNKLYSAVQRQIATKPSLLQAMVKRALRVRKKQRLGEPVSRHDKLLVAIIDKIVFSKVRARFGGRLKYAFCGGAAISIDVAEFIDGLGVTVYEGYGLTETSPIATANWPNSRKVGSVGKAIPGVHVFIGPDQEILVKGPNVMVGYHNRPDENAVVFDADRTFHTGDMGRIDEDGFLYVTGRIKEQYKLENGKYVVPTPLEEQLKLSPYVLNAMVYGDNRPYNVALVVANLEAVKSWSEAQELRETKQELRETEHGLRETKRESRSLLESARVRKLFASEIERLGAKFKGFEGVRDFALVGEDFTTENGMLTPSLKVKRRAVVATYGSLIDALYSNKSES